MKTAISLLAVIGLIVAVHVSDSGAQEVAKPEPVKTLHLQLFKNFDNSLDPRTASLVGDTARVHALAYEGLYHWVPSDIPTLEPLLATDFPSISEDGLTWTIKLRKGVKFHKNKIFGKERTRDMTAADVVASIKRIAAKPEGSSYWLIEGEIIGLDDLEGANSGSILAADSCEGLKAIDDETLQIKLKRPFGSLLSLLAHPGFGILPVEAMKPSSEIALSIRTVGTGPYRLQAVSKDEVYAFKKNSNYWGDESYYDRIVFSCEYLGGRRINDVAKGKQDELHYLKYENDNEFGGDTLELIRAAGTSIEAAKFGGMPYIAFNMKDELWGSMDDDGRALRKAVCMALSRDSFEQYGLSLYAQDSDVEGMYPVGMEGADIGINAEYNEVDVTEAAKLLEGTKFEGGRNADTGKPLEFHVGVSGGPEQVLGVEGMRDALSAIGIKVKTLEMERGDDPSKFFDGADGKANAALSMWFLDTPDAQNFLQLFSSKNIEQTTDKTNFCGYKSDEFDKALNELNKLPLTPANREARREFIQMMTDELKKDRPYIPMADFVDLRARNQKLVWPSLPPGGVNDLRFLKEKEE
ncbi:MAG: ABC transporter substrate-binding protein [Planctomycetota bacterium]